jgi:regulator of RNase E activity RraA
MLSVVPEDAVLVCQPNDGTLSHMGELSAESLFSRGIRGYVVDGGCRDTEFIENLGFNVFSKYRTPLDIVGRWKVDSTGQPIVIAGVKIRSGDLIFGDRDGVLVIPDEVAVEVINRVVDVIQTENKVRTGIVEKGMSPKDAYLKYGKF